MNFLVIFLLLLHIFIFTSTVERNASQILAVPPEIISRIIEDLREKEKFQDALRVILSQRRDISDSLGKTLEKLHDNGIISISSCKNILFQVSPFRLISLDPFFSKSPNRIGCRAVSISKSLDKDVLPLISEIDLYSIGFDVSDLDLMQGSLRTINITFLHNVQIFFHKISSFPKLRYFRVIGGLYRWKDPLPVLTEIVEKAKELEHFEVSILYRFHDSEDGFKDLLTALASRSDTLHTLALEFDHISPAILRVFSERIVAFLGFLKVIQIKLWNHNDYKRKNDLQKFKDFFWQNVPPNPQSINIQIKYNNNDLI